MTRRADEYRRRVDRAKAAFDRALEGRREREEPKQGQVPAGGATEAASGDESTDVRTPPDGAGKDPE